LGDKLGQTVDFLLTARRDLAAARRFCRKACKTVSGEATSPKVESELLKI
jgi:transposase-like protein